jgi:hypothetical protein
MDPEGAVRSSPRWWRPIALVLISFLGVGSALAAQQSVIIGVIRDARGNPVLEAEAVLVRAGKKEPPNYRGWFTFDSLDAGPELLVVRAIGYQVQQLPVTLGPSDTLELEVTMPARAQMLPEVTVKAAGRELSGLAAISANRMLRNGASLSGLITREDIETWGKFDMGDVLRRAGLQVVGTRATCPGRGLSEITVYLDGVLRLTDPTSEALSRGRAAQSVDIRDFVPSQIEAIEVYRSVATRPIEFNATGGRGCLILVWTRR